MRDLHIAHVKIVVREDRTAYRTHEDRPVLQPEVLQRFGNQLVDHAVSAAGAVVRLVLQLRLAIEQVKEDRRAGMDFFVSVGIYFGIEFGVGCGFRFGVGFDFNFGFKFGFNFQLIFLIHFADHALVCHFPCPLTTRSTWNWFQTAVFKPPP